MSLLERITNPYIEDSGSALSKLRNWGHTLKPTGVYCVAHYVLHIAQGYGLAVAAIALEGGQWAVGVVVSRTSGLAAASMSQAHATPLEALTEAVTDWHGSEAEGEALIAAIPQIVADLEA